MEGFYNSTLCRLATSSKLGLAPQPSRLARVNITQSHFDTRLPLSLQHLRRSSHPSRVLRHLPAVSTMSPSTSSESATPRESLCTRYENPACYRRITSFFSEAGERLESVQAPVFSTTNNYDLGVHLERGGCLRAFREAYQGTNDHHQEVREAFKGYNARFANRDNC